jgi:hypothetical protein
MRKKTESRNKKNKEGDEMRETVNIRKHKNRNSK